MKTQLPYTDRNNLTLKSNDYIRSVSYEIDRLKEEHGDIESIMRLQCALDNTTSANCKFDINIFASDDGQAIYYNKWKADNPEHIFIYLNGLESHAGWFSELAHDFITSNITVYAIDRRGSGLNSRNTGSWQEWVEDIIKLTCIAKTENPNCKTHLVSICFGAKISAACAIKHPQKFDSLIYMSPGLEVKVKPTLKEKFKIGMNILFGYKTNIASPIREDRLFTDSSRALYFLYNDKLRTYSPRASDFYQSCKLDTFIREKLKSIMTPSLALFAENDQIVNNKKTQKILKKFHKPPEIVEYPESQHVIFFGRSKPKMITDIKTFIACT